MKIKIVEDGGLSTGARWSLVIVGAAIVFISLSQIESILLMLFGLVLAAVGGYSSKAKMLGLKPFGKSAWREAKRSYEEPSEGTSETRKSNPDDGKS
ncbi:hypothetical protein [Cupriavidus alkaliphilus]|uniref:hypothetical protein n=1 Tax=Cupriavidus alkaliphilus TaxID=942866 RepID=UPI00161987BC|nr:hypothetical protein [Cupriavidus alkaliphilus]MBB3012760.1 hypothetical protein [Cupriavidus alkaliphilus]